MNGLIQGVKVCIFCSCFLLPKYTHVCCTQSWPLLDLQSVMIVWRALHFGTTMLWLWSCQGILSFLSAPIIGALSDVWGRKPFLLLTVTFTCMPIPLMKFSPWWVPNAVKYMVQCSECRQLLDFFDVEFVTIVTVPSKMKRTRFQSVARVWLLSTPQRCTVGVPDVHRLCCLSFCSCFVFVLMQVVLCHDIHIWRVLCDVQCGICLCGWRDVGRGQECSLWTCESISY